MLKFLVKNQRLETLKREIIASDQIAFVTVKFIFEGGWKSFHKVVQFTQEGETYNRVLGTDGTSCLLPFELHSGVVKMSLFGYDAENTEGLRATTVPVALHIRLSGFVGDGNPEILPTPDLYAQLLAQIGEIHSGASAYELAVENGYSGTLEEWILSLKGENGKDGQNGSDGTDGQDGYLPTIEVFKQSESWTMLAYNAAYFGDDTSVTTFDVSALNTVSMVLWWNDTGESMSLTFNFNNGGVTEKTETITLSYGESAELDVSDYDYSGQI